MKKITLTENQYRLLLEKNESSIKEKLLTEKLADVDLDVDFLYDTYFKEDIDNLNEIGILKGNMFQNIEIDTSILKSVESKQAHSLNPCKILINKGINGYQPITKILYLSVSFSALNHIINNNGDLNAAYEDLSTPTQKNNFSREFTEEKVKGSIHHELAHWLDDTFNKQHIEKRIRKQIEAGSRNLKNIPVNMEKFEIQGQIHNVKQLHNKYKDTWDYLSFSQMLSLSPALTTVKNQLNDIQRKEWIRDLKTRMYRENLLGKKMINT
jgi:hypothetical protein